MQVLFPLPLGPRKPKIVPLGTEKVSSSTAVNCPNFFVRPFISMAFMAATYRSESRSHTFRLSRSPPRA